jgi:hypothetical protein
VEAQIRLADREHVVLFYEDDDELVRLVGGYLVAAAHDGAALLVIATPQHREAFRAALLASGADVAGATASSITMLDAAEALSEFMVDGRPDALRFDASVAQRVRHASSAGPLRAYGEMVALLWEAGNVTGAIELEELWNHLTREASFSLFCSYPGHAASPTHEADGYDGVCRLHSTVIAGPPTPPDVELTRRFDRGPSAPGAARRFVADTFARWGRRDLVDRGVLIAGELCTNAVFHARSAFTVGLSRRRGAVSIVVGDCSPSMPRVRAPDVLVPGGRGLRIVDALSHRWGCDVVHGGKLVWAELTHPRGVADARRSRTPV